MARQFGNCARRLAFDRLGDGADVWEKVVRKLRGRLMPPSGSPRPDDTTYEAFASWVEKELDANALAHPDPGHTQAFRRLNRTEYQNAVRDLLALDIDGTLIGEDLLLRERHDVAGIRRYSVHLNRPISQEILDSIRKDCDAAIVGIAN